MTLRSIVIEVGYPTFLKYDLAAHVITHGFTNVMGIRGVSSILDLGGQVVHNTVKLAVALKWQVGFENGMKLTPIFTIIFISKMLTLGPSHN